MTCIEVTYADHQVGHFAIPEGEGWKVDAATRMIVVGRGVPRKLIPLDGVQVVEIVDADHGPQRPPMPMETAERTLSDNDQEQGELACAWADYRHDYQPSTSTLGAAHKALTAGWIAHRDGDQSGVLR